MDGNNIDLMAIKDLNGKSFYIPSYQRGYRWTDQQVRDLLDDVNEFSNSGDSSYCLQPLVVCEKANNKFNVIDGQQRLTTIYLILNELKYEERFLLKYSRESYIATVCKENIDSDSFDKCWNAFCKRNPEYDKIEMFYLMQARFVVKEWFNKVGVTDRFKAALLTGVQFIWYPIPENKKEHEFFKNLNIGKIPLTNAELIKALFLNSTQEEITNSLIADEYDKMERTLRDDDFWYFIAGKQEKPSSCLELLFKLMLDTSGKKKDYKDKNFGAFFYFKDLVSEAEASSIWEDVRKYFYILDGWYKNSVVYNLVGYLRSCDGSEFTLENIYDIYKNSESKDSFILSLRDKCKESIDYPDYMNLGYRDSKLCNLLLFLNIATLISSNESGVKFQFDDFHKNNWDVEHISPKNPDTDDLISKIQDFYKENGDKKPPKDLKELLDKDDEKQIVEKYFASDDVLNSLENLTLLSDHTNRGIGNNFFFEKRRKIIEYYKQGNYIPPCAMNVFQKFYTDYPDNLLFWDKKDQKKYGKAIKDTVEEFFKGSK